MTHSGKLKSTLAKAREFVRHFPLPQAMLDLFKNEESDLYGNPRGSYYDGEYERGYKEMNGEILAKSLGHYFDIIEEYAEPEEELRPGRSKTRGLPDLPSSIDWPENTLFIAQFNLAELSKSDPDQLLPIQGMLYFFLDPVEERSKVIYFNGPESDLKTRDYPDFEDNSELDDYVQEFTEGGCNIEFKRKMTFFTEGVFGILPEALKKGIEDISGCELVLSSKSPNIFGKPKYWQGEIDRHFNYDDDEVDEDDSEAKGNGEAAKLMLFQYQFGEGHIHYWISPGDLAKSNFDTVDLDYSGT